MKINNFNSKSMPLYLGVIMSIGFSSAALAGTPMQVDSIEFPANVVYLKEKSDGSIFVGYESEFNNDCSGTNCFGFGVIGKDNSVNISKSWIAGSFVDQDLFNEKATAKMDNKGNVYVSLFPSKEILKLSDPAITPRVVFEAPPLVNRDGVPMVAEVRRVNDFLFNKDFSEMYVGLQVDHLMMHGMAAVDLKNGDNPIIWHDSRTKARSVQFNSVSNELVYQGYNINSTRPLVAYVMSATNGKYIKGGEPVFTGKQSVQSTEYIDNFSYGLNFEDCKVTKMKLIGGEVGEKVWSNEADGCDANVINGGKKTIALNSYDNFIYAGYKNIISVFDRASGNKKFNILPPFGGFYGDIKFNSNNQKAYRLFTDGTEYGVLEFDSEGETHIYKLAEKSLDFVTVNNHLYVGEGNNVVSYKLVNTNI